ncbi:MAG: poly-gamma-glutamate biosynthesis protein PgsC [Myxococcales bacterium]|nr:MAG: poly-gamma-glutamate biosynthesis protein PgsC [Myxococcales bacterium]
MYELLPLAIGIGLAVGLLFTELFGIATGGMIVPGYVALYLNQPLDVAATLIAGFATFGVVRALSSFLIVYGRRRTALMILIGYVIGMLMRDVPGLQPFSYDVIGYIIPGLIALWMDRQGVMQTLASLTIVACIVRLVLILVVGTELLA